MIDNSLVALIDSLKIINKESEIIKKLQEINAFLLKNYCVQIDRFKIIPLLIEAYYYKEGIFEDENTYKVDERQEDSFRRLYFHRGPQSDGIDICLSDEKGYYIAFLIKNALLIDENSREKLFVTQANLFYELQKRLGKEVLWSFDNKDCLQINDNKDCLLINDDDKREEYIIANYKRKNTNKPPYNNEYLASLPINLIKNYPFENKEVIVKGYLDEKYLKDREDMCIELLGYRSSFVIGD